MSTDYADDEPGHDADDDGWQEYKDDQLMGEPREEPEEEPPLSLEEIRAAYDEAGGAIWELGPAARTVAAGLLQLLDYARRTSAERAQATHRHEYTVTDGPPPLSGAELVSGEQADLVLKNNPSKAVWQRDAHAGAWYQLSSEPAF